MLDRTAILKRVSQINKRLELSSFFGGELSLSELMRADWKGIGEWVNELPASDSEPRNERMYAGLFACGVLGPDGAPMFTREEVLGFADPSLSRDLWSEVVRIGDMIYTLSEVSPESLKSGDTQDDAG